MTAKLLYEMRNIGRTIGDHVILDIEHLQLPEGAVTAVVGPNGAGKSTLLKLLAFLETPSSGEIIFDGKNARDENILDLRRSVTLVNQAPLLFRGTVSKNVAYGLMVRGVPKHEWPHRVAEALKMVDLAGYENRSVRVLSGGEIQRAAIARALVFRPRVILMDEPTAGVDAARVEMVETVIKNLNKNFGANIVFSTHNIGQAFRLTENVISLSGGVIVDEHIENVFSGRVENENGAAFFIVREDLKFKINSQKSGSVRCMIPASAIDIQSSPNVAESLNRLQGTITRMELRRENVRLRIEGKVNLRAEVAREKIVELGIFPGSRVVATFKPEAIIVIG